MSVAAVALSGARATAKPVVGPTVDAIASVTRPRDFGAAVGSWRRREPQARGRALALAVVLLAHAGALAAVAFYQRAPRATEDFEEIPIEIVVAAEPASVAPQAPAEAPPRRSARLDIPAAPDAAEIPLAVEQDAAQAREQRVAASIARAAVLADEPPASLAVDNEAARAAQAAEAARAEAARLAEMAHRRERDRARREAEAERQRSQRAAAARAEARRETVELQRRAARQEASARRERVARLESGRTATRLAPQDAFNAASYRSIVASRVRGALSRACAAGGGGRVVVALTIGASGEIAGVSLASASGNRAIDAAAVAAVRSAGSFPPPSGRARVSVPLALTCR